MATALAAVATTSKVEGHADLDLPGFGLLDLRPGLTKLLVWTRLVRTGDVKRMPQFRCAADVWRWFKGMADLDRECMLVLLLDRKNRLTGIHVASIGCLVGTLASPRELFKAAVLASAASVALVHNHPSGDQQASREDREITLRLKAAGETLGIELLDHVIIGEAGWYSFQEAGVL